MIVLVIETWTGEAILNNRYTKQQHTERHTENDVKLCEEDDDDDDDKEYSILLGEIANCDKVRNVR